MISDQDIRNLISQPKEIVGKHPAQDFWHTAQDMRCNVELRAVSGSDAAFRVFVRRHSRFIENFSIGLRYQTGERTTGHVTLVRYNGAHGEYSLASDGHYAVSHIHRITQEELAAGHIQPQERIREITDRFRTFEQALRVFFEDTTTRNFEAHFENLRQARLFP